MIAINPPTSPARKSTLIVCPVALLDQWQQEIDLKTDLNLSCLIYHGNNKPKRATEISKYDIVLTTFHVSHDLFYGSNPPLTPRISDSRL